jgi:hypothetical protein
VLRKLDFGRQDKALRKAMQQRLQALGLFPEEMSKRGQSSSNKILGGWNNPMQYTQNL